MGSKMKPYNVIPGNRMKSQVAAVKDAIVKCSPNDRMNDKLTNDWVTEVWGTLSFEQRFLVWDSFKCHVSDTYQILRKIKIITGVIPGCTKFLQPY